MVYICRLFIVSRISDKWRIPFIFLILFAVFLASCKEESHKNIIFKSNFFTDSLAVDHLNYLSWEASATDFEKAKNLADSALQISKNANYSLGIGKSYSRIALAFDYKGDYDTAFTYFNKAIDIFTESDNKPELAKIYNNIGASYYVRARYVDAVVYYQKSLEIREALDDKKGIGQSLNNMGLLYRVQKNYPRAIENYKKSIEIRSLINDSTGILYAEQNLAVAFEKLNEYDSALVHYNNAIHLSKMLNDSISLGANLSNACILNTSKGNFELAIQQAGESERILRRTNEKHVLAYSITTDADLYLKTNQLGKALRYAKEGLELSKQLNFPDLMQSCYSIISKIYARQGDYKNAYNYHVLNSSVKDSTLNVKSSKQLKELQTKYETAKKEQRIEQLTSEKQIADLQANQRTLAAISLAVLLLVIVVVFILFYRHKRLRNQKNESELKQRLLRTQMNPHFIFNALGSIQNFIYTNKPEKAGKYLTNFSKLMRDILESSSVEQIPLEQELNIVRNYLLLQEMRKEGSFSFTIEAPENTEEYIVPPMFAQPFIENALIHAFKGVSYKGLVQVKYSVEEPYFIIGIKDNGIGMNKNAAHKTGHKSMAMELTKQRLSLFNHKNIHSKIEISRKDENGEEGTLIKIFLPLEKCLRF